MLKTIRIIRPLNLAMMAGVMLLARYCLILPAFETEKIITGVEPEHLGRWMFALLTFGTCCIGAAGNVINDRFDVLTDSVNRPGTNIVGEKITIKQAETIFIVLSIIGSFIGVFMGLSSDKPFLAVIHPFTALSLWMYSSFYKRRMLSGNFMIACLTFLIILLPGLFEPEFYRNIQYLLLYALIGFLVTLAREIVKDAEDVDGDERMQ
ncbi:MAG: UbiA family prenyltransferase, partial [Flavobacteriales bacterium]